ncbi:hypothetical protein Tco_0158348 [Tanacetum coccineum]
MNQTNQRRDFSKSYSSVRRPFAKTTAQMSHFNAVVGNWGSAVKTSASYNWRNSRPNFNYNSGPTYIRTEHPLKNMVDRGIFDSGCSGHMTGNKDQLEDFEEFNGGSVTFGGSKGYISGKGRIRVGNLDFDSVSFVKELGHFNLFSISQICDKQHKVLFTETECLVVSSDFKMPDENQILLKVPRHHNMYSFDMKTPSPAKGEPRGNGTSLLRRNGSEYDFTSRHTMRTSETIICFWTHKTKPFSFINLFLIEVDSPANKHRQKSSSGTFFIKENEIEGVHGSDIASLLYIIGWVSLKSSYDEGKRNQSSDKLFIPMPTLMSGLKIAFILSSEDQGLFRKQCVLSSSIAQLLAILYVRFDLSACMSSTDAPSNAPSSCQWACFFHHATLGTNTSFMFYCRLIKVHGVSDSTSILHRLKPKKHMDLEKFVMKYLKDLPATTILGITILEDKYMTLLGNLIRPSTIKDSSTQSWLMVSRFNSKREPLVVLLPVNPILVGISEVECPDIFKSSKQRGDPPWGKSNVLGYVHIINKYTAENM